MVFPLKPPFSHGKSTCDQLISNLPDTDLAMIALAAHPWTAAKFQRPSCRRPGASEQSHPRSFLGKGACLDGPWS